MWWFLTVVFWDCLLGSIEGSQQSFWLFVTLVMEAPSLMSWPWSCGVDWLTRNLLDRQRVYTLVNCLHASVWTWVRRPSTALQPMVSDDAEGEESRVFRQQGVQAELALRWTLSCKRLWESHGTAAPIEVRCQTPVCGHLLKNCLCPGSETLLTHRMRITATLYI